ncbi:FadR/GntR family transcriptional regulator [Corallococcus sp. CA049B]|uniref:FadR/GntR family transcriptional regulator n=1 Tax=Corallococcus sp. CA049B TaxID=2316730 RepID=UPI001F38102C|nr:GntR family transcriptional regulator [Corallococcus sp. CA049B]
MERRGLVAYVEAQIERDIALGRLHPSGQFGSEAKLARRYEVCRGTIREALRRLAARGLVVQRSGRKTRAVALDESLTLENLGLALHDARNPKARWLLEGYFSLKRQVLVELLADCCARASDLDLDRLGSTCFQLQDAAHWESGETCAHVEFELLRQAARVAARPGHVLLVQSLQRAFLGGAARLMPLMGGEALRAWALCVTAILHERDVQALQNKLPALLKARDDRVLDAFAPAPPVPAAPEAPCAREAPVGAPAPASGPADESKARPGVEERGADDSSSAQTTSQAVAMEARPCVEEHGTDTAQDEAPERKPCGEKCSAADSTSAVAHYEASELHLRSKECGASASSSADAHDAAMERHLRGEELGACASSSALPSSAAPAFALRATHGEGSGNVMDVNLGLLSDCRTGFAASPTAGDLLQPEPSPLGTADPSFVAVRREGETIHDAQGPLGAWTAGLWRFLSHFLGLSASRAAKALRVRARP